MGPKYEIQCSIVFGGKIAFIYIFPWHWTLYAQAFRLYPCMPRTLFVNWLNKNNEPDLWFDNVFICRLQKWNLENIIAFLV